MQTVVTECLKLFYPNGNHAYDVAKLEVLMEVQCKNVREEAKDPLNEDDDELIMQIYEPLYLLFFPSNVSNIYHLFKLDVKRGRGELRDAFLDILHANFKTLIGRERKERKIEDE